ncbi:unnamed protein product [Heligmosomoides polygyrus]|uniref:Uncharacterized protein n=1 Tax=Heligmosomoides polygyrus TaxID=6339 RepID=A0A183GDQ0_HELPZ|nr:unnamed protein product [Heligmosomoides polygyrus]
MVARDRSVPSKSIRATVPNPVEKPSDPAAETPPSGEIPTQSILPHPASGVSSGVAAVDLYLRLLGSETITSSHRQYKHHPIRSQCDNERQYLHPQISRVTVYEIDNNVSDSNESSKQRDEFYKYYASPGITKEAGEHSTHQQWSYIATESRSTARQPQAKTPKYKMHGDDAQTDDMDGL